MSQWIKILNAGRNICTPQSSNCLKITNVGTTICAANPTNCIKINDAKNKLGVPQPIISNITSTSFITQFSKIEGATRYFYQVALDVDFLEVVRFIYLSQPTSNIPVGGITSTLTPGILYFQRIRAEDEVNNRFSDYSFNSIQLLS